MRSLLLVGSEPLLERSTAEESQEICIGKPEEALDDIRTGVMFLENVVYLAFPGESFAPLSPGVLQDDVVANLVDPAGSPKRKEFVC